MRHSSHPHYAHGTKNETFLLWATFSYLCTDWIGRMNLKICSSSRRVTVLKVFQLEILWKTRWADFCEQITKTEQISNISCCTYVWEREQGGDGTNVLLWCQNKECVKLWGDEKIFQQSKCPQYACVYSKNLGGIECGYYVLDWRRTELLYDQLIL